MATQQCAVLFVNPVDGCTYAAAFREAGFAVHETTEWPTDDRDMRDFHVVLVRISEMQNAPMLAARLRAKPHLDQRMLVALVPRDTPLSDRRAAHASGFDEVVASGCDAREVLTRVLRGLRARPDLRCLLPRAPSRPAVA